MDDRLTRMLRAQLGVQVLAGTNPLELDLPGRIQYIKDMALGLAGEAHEALQEVGWKPWASSRHINGEAAFGELRDAWQFLTNLMFAVSGLEPEELADALEARLYSKINLNRARIEDGYTGLDKCPGCRSALDEVPLQEVHLTSRRILRLCGACGATLPAISASAEVSA